MDSRLEAVLGAMFHLNRTLMDIGLGTEPITLADPRDFVQFVAMARREYPFINTARHTYPGGVFDEITVHNITIRCFNSMETARERDRLKTRMDVYSAMEARRTEVSGMNDVHRALDLWDQLNKGK